MALGKKLDTGTCIRAWNFDEGATTGQTIAVKNKNGEYKSVLHIESVKCMENGKPVIRNRLVIKKDVLKNNDFIIIEE